MASRADLDALLKRLKACVAERGSDNPEFDRLLAELEQRVGDALAASAQQAQEKDRQISEMANHVADAFQVVDQVESLKQRCAQLQGDLDEQCRLSQELDRDLTEAMQETKAAEQRGARLQEALRTLEAEWRERARRVRPLDSAKITPEKRRRIEEWMFYMNRANELAALLGQPSDGKIGEALGLSGHVICVPAARPEGNEPHYEESHGVWLARHHGHRIERRADYDECLEDGATYWGARPEGPQEKKHTSSCRARRADGRATYCTCGAARSEGPQEKA